jgi:starch synthase
MKVLFCVSESFPFVKTGGLADIAHSLPKAMRAMGHDVRVILPKYGAIDESFTSRFKFIGSFTVKMNWRNQYAGVFHYNYDGIPFYFIDNEYYFKRDKFYGYFDDGERFAFFSRAILNSIEILDFKPDILHLNDWHTAPSAALLSQYRNNKKFENIKTVFTIHNLKYQGIFPKEVLTDLLDLDDSYYTDDKFEFHGNINFLKSGLAFSDKVTTVSETYAKEIQYPYYGEHLDGLLASIDHKMKGIINGIDYDEYNPQTDELIFFNYSMETLDQKVRNKKMLQTLFRFKEDENIPVIAIVTRFVEAKGLDLLIHILDELLSNYDVQLIALGNGNKEYEESLRYFASKYPDKMSANIFFSNDLAHKLYSGADVFLMPSQYEPCGLSQMISMRYGTIPIVRQTGGLKDSVVSYNKFTEEGNGFGFVNFNAHEFLFIIKDALKLYHDKEKWTKLMKNAMKSDNSWSSSAKEYERLYNDLLSGD